MNPKYTLPLLAAITGIREWAPWPFSTPRDNPWGPPSAKPLQLRDEEDRRKLRLALAVHARMHSPEWRDWMTLEHHRAPWLRGLLE